MTTSLANNPSRLLFLIVLLLLSNLVVFGQVIQFEFLLWDDETFVLRHVQREGGLTSASMKWALTSHDYGWRTPISYLSLFADAELYGFNPGGYHLTNLLLHIASTFLLFTFLRKSTRNEWAAGITAGLFAIHPLHVEPVAWVTGRWELLCGLFWMLGLGAYLRYCLRPSVWRYLWVMLAYICAIASKPMALTFPFALLLVDYWPLHRLFTHWDDQDALEQADIAPVSLRTAIVEKMPLFAITVASTLWTFNSKAQDVAVRGLVDLSWGERVANIVESYAIYIANTFWPSQLTFFYPHPAVTGGFSAWRVACSTILLLMVTLVSLRLAKRHRYLFVGWMWYLGVFTPAVGWLQVENHARADRYTYLPLIGLFFMLCWGLPALFRLMGGRQVLLPVATAAAFGALVVAARVQTSHWSSSRALFEYGLQIDDRNYKALVGMGTLAARQQQFEEAAGYYNKVIDFMPGHSQANYLVGRCYLSLNRFGPAIAALQRSIMIEPDYPRARHMLAQAHLAAGDPAAASQAYQALLDRSPNDAEAYLWYGDYLTMQGDYAVADLQYRQGLAIDPRSRVLPKRIGSVLDLDDRPEEAVQFYQAYVGDHPERHDVADALAWMLATHRNARVRDGVQATEIAQRLSAASNQQNYLALDTLAAAYAEAGDYQQAKGTLKRALQLVGATDNRKLADELESRLQLYEDHRPYRQQARANPSERINLQGGER